MEKKHASFGMIADIIGKLEGNIGKRKQEEIKRDLLILNNHINSNIDFAMTKFTESMDKKVTEAKHSIANYIDSKVHALGLEGLRNQLQVSIDTEDNKKLNDKNYNDGNEQG